MTLMKVFEWIGNHLLAIIVGLSAFIQISPIKINPWTSLFKWIGSLVNGETDKDIKEIKKIISDNQTAIDENEKDRIRWEILDFANSCRKHELHSKEEFTHVIALKDKYEKLLEKTGDTNGVFEAEYQYILNLYAERLEKNDFL